VVEAAEGIVGVVLAVGAGVRAAEAIVVLVAVEIAAIVNKQQLWMGRSATAPHHFLPPTNLGSCFTPQGSM
jgi:hypothetical protein